MFMPGETVIESDISVTGEHKGRMKLRIALQSDEQFQVCLDRSPDENGEPRSAGFAEYDGIRRNVADMAD